MRNFKLLQNNGECSVRQIVVAQIDSVENLLINDTLDSIKLLLLLWWQLFEVLRVAKRLVWIDTHDGLLPTLLRHLHVLSADQLKAAHVIGCLLQF